MNAKTVRLSNDPWSEAFISRMKALPHYATLKLWKENPNIEMCRTPYWQWLTNILKMKGSVWGGILNNEEDIKNQYEKFKMLVAIAPNWIVNGEKTREVVVNGVNETWHYGPVSVRIEDNGHFTLFDGNHRTVISIFNNWPVEVNICERSDGWKKFVSGVENLYPTGAIYQPIPHPEFFDWKSSLDTTKEKFLNEWFGKNNISDVVDLGTCHGYTLYSLRNTITRGVGVEDDKFRIKISDFVLNSINMKCMHGTIEDFIKNVTTNRLHHECIMALNVLHHVMKFNKRVDFENMMRNFGNICDIFIYSLPIERERQVEWMYSEARNDGNYISKITGMKKLMSVDMKIRKLIILKK